MNQASRYYDINRTHLDENWLVFGKRICSVLNQQPTLRRDIDLYASFPTEEGESGLLFFYESSGEGGLALKVGTEIVHRGNPPRDLRVEASVIYIGASDTLIQRINSALDAAVANGEFARAR
jgi:hypothetical protein